MRERFDAVGDVEAPVRSMYRSWADGSRLVGEVLAREHREFDVWLRT